MPATPSPREFGERLKNARERAGVPIEEVIARTKIARRLLEALEAGEFAKLPAAVFMRLFVRQYLEVIKEEIGPWQEAFDAAWERFERDSQPWPALAVTPPRPRRLAPWLVGLGLVLAGVVVVVVVDRGRNGRTGAAVPSTPEALLPLLAPTPAPTPEPTSAPSLTDPSVLVVRAFERSCWVEVRVGEEQPVQRLLQPGDAWEFPAAGRALELILGDGGAAVIEYLGEKRSPVGAAGEVVRLRLGPLPASSQ
ncbi:MAG: RodZ domain-containing protein [Acidobacteriota bacterium]